MRTLVVAAALVCAAAASAARAADPVTITVDTQKTGSAIAPDYLGLSYEMEKVLPDKDGSYYFRADNQALVNVFKTLGVKSLRAGGNTADRPTLPIPSEKDIDSLFRFAQAADVKVLFTLRLREGNLDADKALAKYIWDHYQAQLDAFAIGNEPDNYLKPYAKFKETWGLYMQGVLSVAPGANFCGPSPTGGNRAWTKDFVADFGPSGHLKFVTQHYYPGGPGNGPETKVKSVDDGIAKLLSPQWLTDYQAFASSFAPAVKEQKFTFRLEECNSFYFGGAPGVSNSAAAGLWAIDYLYWWASHDAVGINFHNGDHVAVRDVNGPCWYAAFWNVPAGVDVHPVGYAMKMFDLGGKGRHVPVTVSAPTLTAYATEMETPRPNATGHYLHVTVINKGREAATIRVDAAGSQPDASLLYAAPQGDLAATTGITLGGARIKEDGSWNGSWHREANTTLQLPAGAAVLFRLMTSR